MKPSYRPAVLSSECRTDKTASLHGIRGKEIENIDDGNCEELQLSLAVAGPAWLVHRGSGPRNLHGDIGPTKY